MIQINLLPKELRRSEPTPWPKLLALLASLIVILSVGLIMIYYRFNVLPTVLLERDSTKEEMQGLQERAKEADELEKEIKDFEMREKTILEIRRDRWLWAKKLDQIVDIVPAYIQLESLSVKETQGRRRNQDMGPTIEMDCLSKSADERNIAKFRRRIINSPLWEDINDMPEWPYALEYVDDKPVLKFKAVLVLWAKGAKKTTRTARR
ncbi:MAG: hypothetical protein GXP25_21260 [Planctomycetes bacterium]|nr:hypothetical protein [Planctomycetota bacterium]